jgi:4-alpha-glucanotransferase
LDELLADDTQFLPERAQAPGNIAETSFDQDFAHICECTTPIAPLAVSDGFEPRPAIGQISGMADVWSTDGYFDVDGGWHPTADETRRALRQAMGAADLDSPPAPPPMWFIEHGSSPNLDERGDLRLEDGTELPAVSALPADLPIGYHELTTGAGSAPTTIVVTPRRCPPVKRAWGWATQLYALRSRDSWGIGDLGDLRELARWSSGLGARLLLTNPFHADVPVAPQQPSPYFASSRVWRNINLLRVADIPGADRLADVLAPLADAGRQLNATRRLDRDAVLAVKRPALEALFADFESTDDGAFDAWSTTRRPRLHSFALFCAVADVHGRHFPEWPAEFRHPGDPAVAVFAAAHARRVRFHEWCQWHIERQPFRGRK